MNNHSLTTTNTMPGTDRAFLFMSHFCHISLDIITIEDRNGGCIYEINNRGRKQGICYCLRIRYRTGHETVCKVILTGCGYPGAERLVDEMKDWTKQVKKAYGG